MRRSDGDLVGGQQELDGTILPSAPCAFMPGLFFDNEAAEVLSFGSLLSEYFYGC